MSSEPILIIGAGLGGLVLAQALRRKNVPFRIFERDPQHGARSQGWAMSLHPWLITDMCSILCTDEARLRAMSPAAPLGLHSEGVIYSLTGDKRKKISRFGEGTDQPFVRVERAKLRDWLMEGLSVEWGKRFSAYEEDSNGVTAHFEDGSEARGCFLVGADGISSRVRNQLLRPVVESTRLPLGIIVGEVDATPEQYQRWLKLATSFSVAFNETKRLFVGLKSVSDDRQRAKFYWMFGWFDEDAESKEYWTDKASQKQMHSFVMENIQEFDAEYIDPFRATLVEGILQPPLQMRDMTPPELPKCRVSLLGDAVHPMVPFRGEGGNMAIKDGLVLAEMITQKPGQADVTYVLKEYESEMGERASASVIKSRENTFLRS